MPHRSPLADAERLSLPGRVVLVAPPSSGLMALVAAIALLVLGAYLTLHRYTERTRVAGVLAAERRLVPVSAPGQGQVAQRLVHEGQAVKAGDVLFVVNEPPPAPAHEASPAAANQAAVTAATAQLGGLQAEASRLGKQITTQQQTLAAARAQAQKRRQELKGGSLADPQLLQQLDVVLDERARLQSLEQAMARVHKSIATARTQLDTARQVARAAEPPPPPEPRQSLVKAPFDGTVIGPPAEPGTSVQNRPLLTLAPLQGPLEAQLFVSARHAAQVQAGQAVQLRYRALPAEPFSRHEGTVIEVSAAPVPRRELPEALAASLGEGDSLHRIRVALAADDAAPGLSPGMQVEADILRGSRPLLEWAFGPRSSLKDNS